MQHPVNILIVDDEKTARVIVKRIVEKAGYTIREAQDGIDALELIAQQPPDIVILDIVMPRMDGISTCRELRKQFNLTELPIIMVTSRDSDESLHQCLAEGANDFIQKPVSKEILLARLKNQVVSLQLRSAMLEAHADASRRQRMETVGQFASGVAHNFNNILGIIMGNAELLLEDLKDAGIPDNNVKMILDASQRAATLTDSLLTFAGKRNAQRCESPEDAVKSLIPLAKAFSGNRIHYDVRCENNLPAIQISNSDLVTIMLQLIRNSVEAIEGEGNVQLDVRPIKDGSVSFRVQDSGTGMPDHLVEHAFEPFFSSKNVGTPGGVAFDGSGLGLSVAYNLVSSVGGSMRVLQSGSSGTTIEFTIPQAAH